MRTLGIFILAVTLPAAAGAGLDFELVATGLARPTAMAVAGDGSGRLFVTELNGRIRLIEGGTLVAKPFLDIEDRVKPGSGGGLLGLAFHPDYAQNGHLFVHYIDRDDRGTISRFTVRRNDPNSVRRSTETRAVVFAEPAGNHKGGDIAFGPEGYLYLAIGDGSSGGDPENNAQNLGSPFGKVLRWDVETLPATVPADNPFVGEAGALGEIWAYGLRNPWRMSFDSETGALFVADVGETQAEEVNLLVGGSAGGENFGWRRKEGSFCFEPATDCDEDGQVPPILEYEHDLGCSITGGYRYRGSEAKTLSGNYVYGDFCSGTIWGAAPNRNGVWVSRVLERSGLTIVTFGRDEANELYVVDFPSGSVYRMSSRELVASGFESGRFEGWKRRGAVEIVEPGLAGSGFAVAVAAGDDSALRRRTNSRPTTLEVSLQLRLDELDLAGAEADLLVLEGASGSLARLVVLQRSPRRFRLELRVIDALLGERVVGGFRLAVGKSAQVDVEWSEAGIVRLLKNLRRRGRISDLTTNVGGVHAVELGLPGGTLSGASGALTVDEILLSR